ncbi:MULTISPECIES: DNA alkylation repair protein [Bacteroidaceae]|uniref:DNA alkylation repair protein n=2 Tax=Bacteroides TaxID=816 RepID=A0AAW6HBB4_BACOV|nr:MULTISPECIES: DNA alkylation repair protein [Bacteroides]EXY82492.1 DNA alkylation repair enzyme family protein [Bacteroides fragilis str. 3996 N(B) 6]MCE9056718.1 DNA alkylation repair protein [Bacteroides ovatus]MCS3070701.1 DNA alkylation repair protein [Bacteroides thetaiotaomicron]MDC2706107.1 DNA alkylation repair protein [Bacteroides ovatus]MDC2715129.1 DNA alkylation repair protein [Bacteroides ovatus]
MLKVVSESHWDEVFDFVVHYKNAMSQTTLRYAIEKIPTYLRIYPYKA